MKAFILAAGYGTRLEPLTIAVPKPMVPIVNLPTMQHNIELLKRFGFNEIVANIHYHPEQLENYFSDGQAQGVNLAYSFEEELLGTAGGVKRMATTIAPVNETFLVLSSDALTDINLDKMIAFHKKNKALVTIALCKTMDVSHFGVVVLDDNGKIIAFQEKPKASEAKSDLVNAGIYLIEPEILKLIPDGFYDFGRQLFPELVARGAPIFGYPMIEYWSDVGNLEKYVQSNYDAMKGLVQLRIPGKKVSSSTWIGEREKISPSARFEGSVIIGDSCVIGDNVYIKDSVIGDKCFIDEGAIITGSILWSDVVVRKRAQVAQAVVGNWCFIGEESRLGAGSIVSNRCLIRRQAIVLPQTKLQPNSVV